MPLLELYLAIKSILLVAWLTIVTIGSIIIGMEQRTVEKRLSFFMPEDRKDDTHV